MGGGHSFHRYEEARRVRKTQLPHTITSMTSYGTDGHTKIIVVVCGQQKKVS